MQATKYTVKIEIEVLSLDTVQGLLMEAQGIIGNENVKGLLLKNDGDTVKWETESKQVDF